MGRLFVVCFFILLCPTSIAQDLYSTLDEVKKSLDSGSKVFAILPKRINEPFFDEVTKGCKSKAKELGVECHALGFELESSRAQLQLFNDLTQSGIDGIALSSAQDKKLARLMSRSIDFVPVPFIAFDTPFESTLVRSFVGTKNFAMGKALGNYVKTLKPQGGTVCIQYSRSDSVNHVKRLEGILSGLGLKDSPDKWEMVLGCPIEYQGDYDRAVRQLQRILHSESPDVLLMTGGGAQFNERAYRRAIEPYKEKVKHGSLIIGAIDTQALQLDYINENLSTVNVGQRPYQIGVEILSTLMILHDGKNVPATTYIPSTLCVIENINSCLN